MPRQRAKLTFGYGVDRASGAWSSPPSSMYDLRDFLAVGGKLSIRQALSSTWFPLFTTETDVIGIFPLLATRDIVVVTYNRPTRVVNVWRINPITIPTLQFVAGWSTLDVNAPFKPPRVNAAESFGKLYLAHEEVMGYRMPTKVYTPNANDALVGSLATLQANLDNTAPANVYFRCVLAYNDSLWGAGFGSASDQDRPEVVRVSDPIAPDTFRPEALFYVGARKDPVIALVQAGSILAVRKRVEGYRISGTSAANYGLDPAEKGHGCEAARLVVAYGEDTFCWDHSGPRRILGDGSSVAIGQPLELLGPAPSAPPMTGEVEASDPGQTFAMFQQGFAVAEPNEPVVRFVFPAAGANYPESTWPQNVEYLLSLSDPRTLSWSYSQLRQPVCCAGVVLMDKAAAPASAAVPSLIDNPVGAVTLEPGGRTVSKVLAWTNTGFAGDELVRVWVRYGGVDTLAALTPILQVPGAASRQQVILHGLLAYETYEFLIDYVREDGTAQP